jgi:hypothetical protein
MKILLTTNPSASSVISSVLEISNSIGLSFGLTGNGPNIMLSRFSSPNVKVGSL